MTYNKKHKWTDTEIKFLCDNYPTMYFPELQKNLGLTYNQIKGKAEALKLKKTIRANPRALPDLTAEQEKFLKDNYPKMTRREIAEHLGIEYKTLVNIMARESLTKKSAREKKIKNFRIQEPHPLYYNQIFGGIVGNEILKK